MDDTTLIAIVALVAFAIIVGAFVYLRQHRTLQLRNKFGPEYDRALKETGDKSRAEASLEKRTKRVGRLTIRPLRPNDTARYTEEWKRVQARFVDDPPGAITEADHLLGEVMSSRGYPMGDFEQRAEDISVDHPRVVENYRAGHDIALRHAKGRASTEDLRQAMIHYRTLFADLVGKEDLTRAKAAEEPVEADRRKAV
jgi:hypothetical protein